MAASLVDLDRKAQVSLQGAEAYYRDVTRQYGRYAGSAQGWHYGVWDEGVTSHVQALLASNERLVSGVPLGPDTTVLDAGCGCGGFAVWAAERYGCHVTGITLVADHVEQAHALARQRKVEDRCTFLVAEMDELPFADESFDLVTNQDSYCHAVDKLAYLQGVHRVLKRGGSWRAVDFAVQDDALDATEAEAYTRVLEGFQIPSMVSPAQVRALLQQSHFSDIDCEDITALVEPSAEHILGMCRLPMLAMKLRLDWTFFGLDAAARKNRQGHVLAGEAYSTGLLAGYFRHGYYQARKA